MLLLLAPVMLYMEKKVKSENFPFVFDRYHVFACIDECLPTFLGELVQFCWNSRFTDSNAVFYLFILK